MREAGGERHRREGQPFLTFFIRSLPRRTAFAVLGRVQAVPERANPPAGPGGSAYFKGLDFGLAAMLVLETVYLKRMAPNLPSQWAPVG
jgi:hypothetical protein